MAKIKPTIRDIAQALGMNISTVSRALHDHPGISAATKTAVAEQVEKLGYRRNKIASSLRSGRSHTIGIMIPSAELHFFGAVVHAIEQVMNQQGYSVLLYQSNELYEREKRGIGTFLQLHVDGIIASIALGTENFDHFHEVNKHHIPLILFDRTHEGLAAPSVTIDDFKGGYLATEHLVKQGYRRIAHITAGRQIKIFRDRFEGYKSALQANGLPFDAELVQYGEVSIASGTQCMKNLLSLAHRPDAVFAVEDFTAMGALQQLKAAGIAVPGEVGVIGFANESFSAYITPSLSTVDQQTREMGQAAGELFLKMVKGDQAAEVRAIVLDPVLIHRESTNRNPA